MSDARLPRPGLKALARHAPRVVAACTLVLAGFYPVGNPDTFGHLAAGRLLATLRAVPRTDPFSFFRATPQPWFNYEWLSGLLLWQTYALGGVHALLGLKLALLALLGFFLVDRATRDARFFALDAPAHAGWLGAALVALAVPASRVRFSERPHLFGLLLAALYLAVLPRVAAGFASRRAAGLAYAGLAIAHVAWVNLHGSHLFGLLLTAVHLAAYASVRDAKGARALAVLLALECAATAVTPYGPRIVVDAIEHLRRNEYRQIVTEWAPLTSLRAPVPWATYLGSVALSALATQRLLRAGAAGRAAVATLALLAVMALRSQRFLADFSVFTAALTAAPLAQALATRLTRRTRARTVAAATVTALAVGLAVTVLQPSAPFGAGLSRVELALGSGRWIAQNVPDARLLAGVDDAWYVEFASPRTRVLIDGRIPFFGAEFTTRVLGAAQRPEGLEALGRTYPIDTLVTRHTEEQGRRMTLAALARPEWALVFVEDEHAVFLRALSPERAALVERLRLRALPPGYASEVLLDPRRDPQSFLDELRRIAAPGDGVGYRAWAAATLELRALARDGGRAGFRAPRDEAERALAQRAARRLRQVEREVDLPPPSVTVERALAELCACELGAARESLRLARARGGESRDTVLGEMELALREGRLDEVRAFVQAARAGAGAARDDAWLAALEAQLSAPPRCP